MILEVLEGQTKGGYFSYSIFDPSVNQCTGHPGNWPSPRLFINMNRTPGKLTKFQALYEIMHLENIQVFSSCRETPCTS